MVIGVSGKLGSGKDAVGTIVQCLTLGYTTGETCIALIENDIISDATWENKKFAGKLKDIACLILGCTREQLEDREFKEKELGEEWWYYELPNHGKIDYLTSGYSEDVKKAYEPYLKKLTTRILLQLLGTEAGRGIIHPQIWVNSLFADYTSVEVKQDDSEPITKEQYFTGKHFPNWVITDTRFPNEADEVKRRGGILIRLNRWIDKEFPDAEVAMLAFRNDECVFGIDYDGVESLIESEADFGKFERYVTELDRMNHPSETALDNYQGFDHVLENNGSLDELVESIREILTKEGIL